MYSSPQSRDILVTAPIGVRREAREYAASLGVIA